VHPGGIVIAPGPMTDLAPTHLASKGLVITQFDLESVEHLGLVKIDLLGTRGLTVLGEVAGKVYNWHRTEYRHPLAVLESIPADDPATSALVRAAVTIGCFQIESPGMRATLKEIEAQSPEDLMIALALYRPGPMTGGLKSSFVRRHLGQEPVEHLHPALSQLLDNTHGVILYQEQVLLIASQLAGLSLADADLLRRAMSHFDPGEQMRTLKLRFIRGAEEKSAVPPETAERIWDLMAAFAGYGFPKAHAASYAQISWRSAWCKAHYPAEFMAAVLAGWGGYYRQRVYLNEARRLGLQVFPPHINHALRQFSVTYPGDEAALYMGLDQVRDLTRRTQQRILHQRPFQTIEDFLREVDPRPQEAENLIQVGALTGLGTIPALLAHIKLSSWAYGQLPLFEPEIESDESDWGLAQKVEAQLSILGASVDAHPLELAAAEVAASGAISTLDALMRPESEVCVAGVRQTTQRFFAHDGDPFYILELEDLEGVLPVLLTPGFYRQHRGRMSSNAPFLVEGKMTLSPTTGELVLQARRLHPLKITNGNNI
jgi:DNA polymerase-3 subunit alpha